MLSDCDKKKMGKASNGTKECCTARDVLWYLTFIGFGVNYMLRTNLNIAIVSMVKTRTVTNHTLTSECLVEDNVTENFQNHFSKQINLTENEFNATQDHLFPWNEKQQSAILGGYFWLHWVTQIPGGILGSKYGAKIVFGWSNFVSVLGCFFVPMAAYMGHHYLLALRMFQGMIAGFAWPAMHNMTARWIPPNERSKFVTAYLGSSMGAALTYPVCGFIIHRWGWEWVFYVSGVAGTVWFIAWWFLVYDSPAKHPRISEQEKEYILSSLGQTYTKQKAPVPWKDILLSLPVWMNVLAQWGGLWGFFTLMTHGPSYFKFIHGWSIQATGFLSGLGHVLRTTWAYMSALLGDYLLRTNRMSRTNVRKLATAGCTIGQGVCMLGLAFSGCDYTWAVVWLSAAVAMNGSVSTGPLASIVDISPNYASVILGLVNSAAAIVGFITPAVVGQFTFQNQTVKQWQKVFLVSTGMLISSGVLYVLFAALDCDYTLEESLDDGLVVKWFFNETPTPIYQWIPNKKPQELGILKGRLDLEYSASTDTNSVHRALHIIQPGPDLSGDYTCFVSTFSSEDRKTKRMLVFVPEKRLELRQEHVGDGTLQVVCSAEGVFPKPNMSLHVGNSEVNSSKVAVQERAGLFDIRATAEVPSLNGPEEFSCELRIPQANYTVRKEAIYYPASGNTFHSSSAVLESVLLILNVLFVLH